MVVIVTMIDHNDKAEDIYSSSPRDSMGVVSMCSTYALLSQKLGISSIRKYNGSIDDAIRADDVYAVRLMIGCRDRSMIRGGTISIYEVAQYLGYKNIVDSIDDILSLSRDIGEEKRLCRSIAYGAARGGHRTLVIDIIARGADDWNEIAYSAAEDGHMDIVMDMIRRGVNNWNGIAYSAASHGHKDIVMDMIDRGANDWNWIALSAARGGYKDIVMDMIARGVNDWNRIAVSAARHGHKGIVMAMIDRGANHWNRIALSAQEGGHKEIVEYINDIKKKRRA